MNTTALILTMGLAIYALRLTGLLIVELALPTALERALVFVPVAVLTALVVGSLSGPSDDQPLRLIAAAVAVLAVRYSGQAWSCIVFGAVVYGLLRVLFNA